MGGLEQAFLTCRWQLGCPDIRQREYRPFDWRGFRFDLAFPEPYFIAFEVDGETWVQGRHVTGSGFDSDCLKHDVATAAGWRGGHASTRRRAGLRRAHGEGVGRLYTIGLGADVNAATLRKMAGDAAR
jgi:hypothetical protein